MQQTLAAIQLQLKTSEDGLTDLARLVGDIFSTSRMPVSSPRGNARGENKSKRGPRGHQKQRGPLASDAKEKRRLSPSPKPGRKRRPRIPNDVVCPNCQKVGHPLEECPELGKVPLYCTHCKVRGHRDEFCIKKHPLQKGVHCALLGARPHREGCLVRCLVQDHIEMECWRPVGWTAAEYLKKKVLKNDSVKVRQADWIPWRSNQIGVDQPRNKATIGATLNGHRCDRALMDTGSDVNVLPRDLMTTLALNAKPSPIGTLRGFNGADSLVLGAAVCKFNLATSSPDRQSFWWFKIQMSPFWDSLRWQNEG